MYVFYLNNACGICTLLRALRLWNSYTCRLYSFVRYACVALTFSFEWNKEKYMIFNDIKLKQNKNKNTAPLREHTHKWKKSNKPVATSIGDNNNKKRKDPVSTGHVSS